MSQKTKSCAPNATSRDYRILPPAPPYLRAAASRSASAFRFGLVCIVFSNFYNFSRRLRRFFTQIHADFSKQTLCLFLWDLPPLIKAQYADPHRIIPNLQEHLPQEPFNPAQKSPIYLDSWPLILDSWLYYQNSVNNSC